MARLPAPSVSLAACSVFSFKPQMATRAPSRSNSCAAASPIPLLPPVMRTFLPANLSITSLLSINIGVTVTVLDKILADVAYQLREARLAESLLNGVVRGVEDRTELSFH